MKRVRVVNQMGPQYSATVLKETKDFLTIVTDEGFQTIIPRAWAVPVDEKKDKDPKKKPGFIKSFIRGAMDMTDSSSPEGELQAEIDQEIGPETPPQQFDKNNPKLKTLASRGWDTLNHPMISPHDGSIYYNVDDAYEHDVLQRLGTLRGQQPAQGRPQRLREGLSTTDRSAVASMRRCGRP